MTESTLLAVAGGTIGLLMAWWTLSYMTKTEIDGVDISPDATTFAFTLGIALVTGIVFGLSPALHATRGHVATALRDSKAGTVGRSRLQRGFVVAQIMLSQPLLVLLATMLSLVISKYTPHAPEMSTHVVAVGLRPLEQTGALSQRGDAVDSLIPRIAAQPRVFAAVAEATGFDVRSFVVPGRLPRGQADSAPTIIAMEGAAPGWFRLLDVPIMLGRDVALADTASPAYPIVIGSDLARSLWGDTSPVGRIVSSPAIQEVGQTDSLAMTVVGVYDASVRMPGMMWGSAGASGQVLPRVYTARGKHWRRDRVFVRTHADAQSFVPELQRFVRATAPSLPVSSMQTLAQIDAQEYFDTLRMSTLAGAGGALALLLASLGLYGVVSLAVQQRTREIGIRIAVGAVPSQVARMFLASGMRVSVVALLLGLPLSIAALKVAMNQGVVLATNINFWGIGGGITVILLLVASAATWVPARRASRVDPASTLRFD